ncbi:MAG: hypothetical protein HY914_00470 [Desulfomonile tiedjei]|nr:hypothetical protein [Desulfomonile tiedjei]
MNDEKFRSELLRRKFEPISDWRPVEQSSDLTQTLKSLFGETLDQAQKRKESWEKALGPLTEEAGTKIKDMARFIEGAAVKSSKDARSFLAKALETMADKLKP